MNSTWIKIILPIIALGIGIGGYYAINANKKEPEQKSTIDSRPTVETLAVQAEDYQVTIMGHAEVKPLEQTQLSPQVSGEVIHWNPDFVPGGQINKGDVLFSIRKDDYQAALLQAESELVRAESALVEEKARAKVAEDEVRRLKDKSRADLFLRKPQLLSAEANLNSAKAALMSARRNLANCDVKAPYDALVISRSIGIGQVVNAGVAVAVLNNIKSAEIMVPIAGFDRAYLPTEITDVKALIKQTSEPSFQREGTIVRDLGLVDNATRMGYLVVRVDDPYGIESSRPPLKFGSFVEVSFKGKTLKQIYRLNQNIVNNRTVWVVGENSTLEPKHVNVIREENSVFLINEGLTNQDRVVTTIPEYPQQGMEVKLSETKADAQ